MQFILPTFYCIVFILCIYKMKFFEMPDISKTQLLLLFLVKLGAVALVWIVYTYYYHAADFRNYFLDSSKLIYNLFHSQKQPFSHVWDGNFESVLFSSSKAIVIVNAVFHVFSFGNYYVHGVFFAFISFTGLIALYKTFINHFPNNKYRLLFSLFFVPSILFWCSSPGKESLVLAIVGWIVYISNLGLKPKYTSAEIVALLLLLLMLGFFKIYLLVALVLPLLVNVWVAFSSAKYLLLKYAVMIGVFIAIAFSLTVVNPEFNVLQIISNKQAKAISEAKGGAFLANDVHFICLDYKTQYEHLDWLRDSTYRIRPGSNYLMWPVNNMQDTTFVTNSTDTSIFYSIYAVEPAGAVMEIKRLAPEWKAYVAYFPIAIVNVFVQPAFFETNSWFQLLVALENSWVLVLLVLSFSFFNVEIVRKKKEVVAFCWFVALTLFALIGITTPVIGAMVRYKTIGLLFLIVAMLLSFDSEKMKRFFDRREKK